MATAHPITVKMLSVSQSNFAFSSALQEKLSVDGQNSVFSPFSLSLILLLARFGARGQTAAQIEQVLGLPRKESVQDWTATQLAFHGVLKKIRAPTDEMTVTLANRAYLQAGFEMSKEFRRVSIESLCIGLESVNFADAFAASERINSWVSNETHGKFNQLFSPDDLSVDTKLVLVNAIYFKSPWKHPFKPEHTQKAPFYLNAIENTVVDMMVTQAAFASGTLQGLNAKVVSLAYKGDRFSMQVIIPDGNQGLSALLNGLKGIKVDDIRKNLKEPDPCEKVKLHLPKFKIDSKHDLVEPLKEMGAADMFSVTDADFSGIPEDGMTKLSVSKIVQKAFITVDEEGTEAAAATGLQIEFRCLPRITEIKANRPFYYQIVELETNMVLFAGVVRNPNA